MPQAITMIRKEHRNMSRLLDLLDSQVDLFENGIRPDYELMKEIIDYFLTFPDLYHHPKEDLIFRKIKRRAPDVAETLFDLEDEHEKVSGRLHEFTRAVVNVMMEVEMPRDSFVSVARKFIEGERKHIAEEEAHFLPLAVDTLTNEDWAEVDKAVADIKDPLHGEATLRFRAVETYLRV